MLAVLLLLAATLFAIGVSVEHSTKTSEAKPTTTGESTDEQVARGESSEPTSGEHAPGHVETTAENERILGVRADSAAVVTGMVIASLLAAALIWRRPRRTILAGAGAFAAAAVFDIAEVLHQNAEGHTNVKLIAAAVAATHLAAAAVALTAIARPHPSTLVTPAT